MDFKYENGNIHTPVLEVGEDPSDSNNVLISRFVPAVSVPKWTITDTEGTPVPPDVIPPGTVAEKDQEIADLRARLETANLVSDNANDTEKDAEIARLQRELAASQSGQ